MKPEAKYTIYKVQVTRPSLGISNRLEGSMGSCVQEGREGTECSVATTRCATAKQRAPSTTTAAPTYEFILYSYMRGSNSCKLLFAF